MESNNEQRRLSSNAFLRDHLAEYRTTLANERTFLAYIRTALTVFVAGVSFIKFFDSLPIEILGWILIPLGAYTMVKGLQSFRKMHRLIRNKENDGPPPDNQNIHSI